MINNAKIWVFLLIQNQKILTLPESMNSSLLSKPTKIRNYLTWLRLSMKTSQVINTISSGKLEIHSPTAERLLISSSKLFIMSERPKYVHMLMTSVFEAKAL